MPMFGPMTMTRLYSIRNGFAAGPGAQRAQHTERAGAIQACCRRAEVANIDAVCDKSDRTIPHSDIDSAGVPAAWRIKPVLGIVIIPGARG